MAYCEKCGAYIPDGQTKCLACGFDSAARETQRSSGGYAYSYDSEKEEQQRKEQERKAQERKAQERKQRQEEYRRQAEEEFARRQKEQQEQERQAWSRVNASHPYSQAGNVRRGTYSSTRGMNSGARGKGKNRVLAALSYLSILFLLPFIACPEDEFARYHARQGMLLFFFGLVADVIGSIFSIGWLITLFRLYCIYEGMTAASDGRMKPLPLIGKYAEKSGR